MGKLHCITREHSTRNILGTYVTTRIEEKKVARELLTAFKVPASELSIVSMSWEVD